MEEMGMEFDNRKSRNGIIKKENHSGEWGSNKRAGIEGMGIEIEFQYSK